MAQVKNIMGEGGGVWLAAVINNWKYDGEREVEIGFNLQ